MPKAKTILIDGVEQWLHLIRRFKMSPVSALDIMQEHGQNVAEVLVFLENILNSYTLHPMDRNNKIGKVKDLLGEKKYEV